MEKGKIEKYILSELKETPTERKMNYKGTVETFDEYMMKEIIFNHLVENKLPKTMENGLSYNAWANYFGFFTTKNTEQADAQLIDVLDQQHGSSNHYYKPTDITEAFHQAVYDVRRATVKNAFSRLIKEGRISMTSVYMTVVSNDDEKSKVSFIEVSLEKFNQMKSDREIVVQTMGSTMDEYNRNIKKRSKSVKMLGVYKAVEKVLMRDYGVKRFYEAFKVEVLNDETEENTKCQQLDYFFFKRVQKLTKDRHNNMKNKTSTYFSKRFYLLNTSLIFDFLNKGRAIDRELFQLEKDNYTNNLEIFKKDFYKAESIRIDTELSTLNPVNDTFILRNEPVKSNAPVISNEEISRLFDDIKPTETIVTPEVEVKIVNEELEYLRRFKPKNKPKQKEDVQPSTIDYSKMDKGKGYINLEDEEIIKDWQQPIQLAEVQIFGHEYENEVEQEADPIIETNPEPKREDFESPFEYVYAREKYETYLKWGA